MGPEHKEIQAVFWVRCTKNQREYLLFSCELQLLCETSLLGRSFLEWQARSFPIVMANILQPSLSDSRDSRDSRKDMENCVSAEFGIYKLAAKFREQGQDKENSQLIIM